MSKVFDQDAPETQLGFQEAWAAADTLRNELIQAIAAPGNSGDVVGAEDRLDSHLIKFRPLLEPFEEWKDDYAVIDGIRVSSQDKGMGL